MLKRSKGVDMSQNFQVIRENSLSNSQIHSATDQKWVADAQLDKMEQFSAEENNIEYFQELQAETNSAPVKDKMARLTQILAQKNLMI